MKRLGILGLVSTVLLLVAAGGHQPDLLTRNDLDNLLKITHDDEGSLKTITVTGEFVLEAADYDLNGTPETWKLIIDGDVKCKRWYGLTNGPTYGGTIYYPDGSSRTVSWGHHRENEAKQIHKEMKKELESSRHDGD